MLTTRMWTVPSIFSDPFFTLGRGVQNSTWYPTFETTQTEQGVTITADIPGVKATDLDISVDTAVLTIKGTRKDYGKFTKSYELADTLDPETLTASLEDGVLTITIGKMPKAQPRRIAVTEPKKLTS